MFDALIGRQFGKCRNVINFPAANRDIRYAEIAEEKRRDKGNKK